MKKQLYSFIRGLFLGVLIALFIVYGGPSYLISKLTESLGQNSAVQPEKVLEEDIGGQNIETEILNEVNNGDTITNTEENIASSSTSTEESIPNNIELILKGFDGFFLENESINKKSILLDWFAQTAPIEIITYPYDLGVEAGEFCRGSSDTLEKLTTRLDDRIGYARDRHAEQVDQYFEVKNDWVNTMEETSRQKEGSFALYKEAFTSAISNQLIKTKYEVFIATITKAQENYTGLEKNATESLTRELRILRDKRTSAITTAINNHDSAIRKAISETSTSCMKSPDETVAIYFQLQEKLNASRIEARFEMEKYSNTTEAAAIFSHYETDQQATNGQLAKEYRAARAKL